MLNPNKEVVWLRFCDEFQAREGASRCVELVQTPTAQGRCDFYIKRYCTSRTESSHRKRWKIWFWAFVCTETLKTDPKCNINT